MGVLSIIVVMLLALAGAGIALGLTTVLPSVVSVLGSTLVAWAVYRAGRTQDRIKTTLDLHKDYYSPAFAISRRQAEHFYQLHHDSDWGSINPYELDDPEDDLKGYSEVLRFFHRLSILWQRDRLDNDLVTSLFARETGYWMGFIFEPMTGRPDWWTKDDILKLAAHLHHIGSEIYSRGLDDRAARRITGPIRVRLSDGRVAKVTRTSVVHAPVQPDTRPNRGFLARLLRRGGD